MSKPVIDVREYPRQDADIIISCEHRKNPLSVLCWLIDISKSGCMIQSYFKWEEKTLLEFNLYRGKGTVHLRGKVVRTGFDGKTFYYGIQFVLTDYFLRRKVEGYMKWLDSE